MVQKPRCFGAFYFLRTMALPFFYVAGLSAGTVTLDEDTSKHITGVLRMKLGEALLLTDGRGTKAQAVITDDHRKRCTVQIGATTYEEMKKPKVGIALSLIKNAARFEWFLEKATEMGVSEIIPMLCERTEKEKFRQDRMQHILTSAMLQSQQCWLPVLHAPTDFTTVLALPGYTSHFIAHCLPHQKTSLRQYNKEGNSLLLVGPEGDFTEKEIANALQQNFVPVALGNTRLRTETAGMVGAALLCVD